MGLKRSRSKTNPSGQKTFTDKTDIKRTKYVDTFNNISVKRRASGWMDGWEGGTDVLHYR